MKAHNAQLVRNVDLLQSSFKSATRSYGWSKHAMHRFAWNKHRKARLLSLWKYIGNSHNKRLCLDTWELWVDWIVFVKKMDAIRRRSSYIIADFFRISIARQLRDKLKKEDNSMQRSIAKEKLNEKANRQHAAALIQSNFRLFHSQRRFMELHSVQMESKNAIIV